jgi:transposase
VALEATGNALAIARALEPHAARVVVATRTELRAITEAKVKTDRRDARTLARLLAAGLLRGCWLPDEQTRAPRRRLARRAQLVRQRTRAKNEVHAVLMRTLKGRPPVTDAFGKRGRGSPRSSCPATSARRSTAACARSTSSTPRSRSSSARSPRTRSAPRRSSA